MKELKIVHIADVHWRGLSRHSEYREIFSRFFDQVKKLSPDVILIGGDIVHSKTQGISPELIDCLTWWFSKMSEICAVHVILGNHDGILHNKHRQDAISPIVNAMKDKNIHLYKESGVYPVGVPGFAWCVFSCFDEKGWKKVMPSEGNINIALFHGAVWGSKTDIDWNIDGEVDAAFFEDYDFALLGDIHRVQFLNEKKTIAYSGSTIQQNYGESPEKGFLFWKIRTQDDFDVEFHPIPPSNPFITLEWANSVKKTLSKNNSYPQGTRFRIKSSSSIPQVEIEQIKNELGTLYGAQEVVFKIDEVTNDNIISAGSTSLKKKDLRDSTVLLSLLKEYIGEKNLDSSAWDMVGKMLSDYIQKTVSTESVLHNTSWQVKRLEFDNIFSYGSSNVIDFEKIRGITGIFARNRAGKSAIAGSLMYGLFNTTDRGPIKNLHLINARKNHCSVSVDLKIRSENYRIERQSVKYENRKREQNATTSLNLFKLDNDNKKVSDLSAEQRTVTEKVIRKLVGTADDFLLTSLSSQGEMNRFIQQGATHRKRILNKFLDLEIFDKMLLFAKEDSVYIKSQLKNAPDRDWDTVIREKSLAIEKLNKEILLKEDSLTSLRGELQSYLSQLDNYDNVTEVTPSDVERQQKTIKSLTGLVAKKSSSQKEIRKNIEDVSEKIKKSAILKKEFSIDSLKEQLEAQKDIVSNLTTMRHNHETELRVLEEKKASVKRLLEVPCGDSFPTCRFIKHSHDNKQTLPQQLRKVESLLSHVSALEKSLEDILDQKLEEKIEKYESLLTRVAQWQIDLSVLSVSSDRLELEIDSLEENISELSFELVEMQRQVSNFNDAGPIDILKEKISELNGRVQIADAERLSAAQQQGESLKERNSLREEKKKYANLRKQWSIYETFMRAVSKKGVPAQIIKSQLPTINAEIEKILTGVVEFKVELDVDPNSSAMDVYIDYGDSRRIIELASGMEKMISSLAIRVALLNVSTLPKTNLLIIDEGFGTLDENSAAHCNRLLISLKKWFKNILVITHVDTVKDVADNVLEIEKSGMDSKIVFE